MEIPAALIAPRIKPVYFSYNLPELNIFEDIGKSVKTVLLVSIANIQYSYIRYKIYIISPNIAIGNLLKILLSLRNEKFWIIRISISQ